MKKNKRVTNVIIAGIGGQGVLKASDILADVAFCRGLDVKKSEVHGMSQRGGSVTSDVRFGAKVDSPMVPFGDADILVVLSQDQVEIVRAMLRRDGILIAPSMIHADGLMNRKSLNVALLGVASARLPFELSEWASAIERALPEKLWAANHEAFAMGRSVAQSLPPKEPRHV